MRERSVRSWMRWRRSRTRKRLERAEAKLEAQALTVARLTLKAQLAELKPEAQLALAEKLLFPPQILQAPEPTTLEQMAEPLVPQVHFPTPEPEPEPEETPPPAEAQLRDLLQQS